MPAATTASRTTMLSRSSPALIEIAITIIDMAVILARLGMPTPDR
jgi:hypothetical protein